MKIYLRDVFSGGSIDTNKWVVAPTVTIENGEAVITKTTEPGSVAVAGNLTSKVVVPSSVVIHFDSRFITNIVHQSGTGFWTTENMFFRKTDSDWNTGQCMQAFITYHADSDVLIEAFLYLYHRTAGVSPALVGKASLPLDLFESLDIEGSGVVIRDLNIKAQGGKFTVRVADVEVDVFIDPSPLQVASSVQFGTAQAVNLTLKNSIDNILVTSV
jgi:hypothetical protein